MKVVSFTEFFNDKIFLIFDSFDSIKNIVKTVDDLFTDMHFAYQEEYPDTYLKLSDAQKQREDIIEKINECNTSDLCVY